MKKPTAAQLRRAHVEMANWANIQWIKDNTGTALTLQKAREEALRLCDPPMGPGPDWSPTHDQIIPIADPKA
jgi:hypothetical protein